MYTKADFSSSKLIIYNVQKNIVPNVNQVSMACHANCYILLRMYIRKVQGVPYGLRRFYFVDRCFPFAQIYFRIIYIFDAYWLDYYIGKADQKCGYENFERNFFSSFHSKMFKKTFISGILFS